MPTRGKEVEVVCEVMSGRWLLAVGLALAACSSPPPPSLVGTWTASNGSESKVIHDDGTCTGFGSVDVPGVNLGGPTTCTLADEPDPAGRYRLDIAQSNTGWSYLVTFDGDTASVYTRDGAELLYVLTRK